MVKRKIENPDFLENSGNREQDKLTSFLLGGGKMRAVLCNGSLMINQMRANHQLQIAETLILGRNYLAASLLSANLKEEDVIKIQVSCSGPLGGLNVEADHNHNVRGYLFNNPINAPDPGSMALSDYFGAGVLSFTRLNRMTNKPFTGQIEIQYGNTARDLAYYFTASEQLATAFKLDVSFSDDGNVKGAGGLLIQALPGTDDELLLEAEKTILDLPSLGQWFADDKTSESFISERLASLEPQILASSDTEFFCPCSKERIRVHISALPDTDKQDIISKNDFPIKSLCHNCGTSYLFSREESMELFIKEKKLQ
ncbi:Hsp33 family molecular chaperone HslO [Spirochaeta isovalerica]|uniref:Molecular chaperone Hsp33 n=1 Tax=Spirochaeta isovalerica TaxID=150 RepID=A0A841RHB6_9SPIO|nr:Hsp33 family molecular chaperone HslO [Spirochaeta isovalerica]MBB6481918.1 molecular chaperone Hsp33 [Spirochaeta isovalerica]